MTTTRSGTLIYCCFSIFKSDFSLFANTNVLPAFSFSLIYSRQLTILLELRPCSSLYQCKTIKKIHTELFTWVLAKNKKFVYTDGKVEEIVLWSQSKVVTL